MKRDWKPRYFLAAVGVIAIASKPWIWEGPQARAQEPGEWCDTYVNWVAEVGNQRAVAGAECPTYSTCDTPPVRDSWIPGPSTPIVTIRIKFHIFCNDDGTNCASSPSGVAAQMTQLNSDYPPYRIQFTESTEAEYINNSTYRDLAGSEVVPMKNTYADDPAHQVNVYVADLPGGLLGRGTFPFDPRARWASKEPRYVRRFARGPAGSLRPTGPRAGYFESYDSPHCHLSAPPRVAAVAGGAGCVAERE